MVSGGYKECDGASLKTGGGIPGHAVPKIEPCPPSHGWAGNRLTGELYPQAQPSAVVIILNNLLFASAAFSLLEMHRANPNFI